ncbi:MAG: S8/S53 family peptidase [Planctomycetota bacterium]|jgi:hypothetical protein
MVRRLAVLLLPVVTLVLAAPRADAQHDAEPVASRTLQLPRLGMTVKDVRTLLPDGRVARAGLDAAGNPVDVDSLRRQEHALAQAARGNMAPTLFDAVGRMAAGETLEIAFWLHEPDDGVELDATLRSRVAGLGHDRMADAVRAARRELLTIAQARFAPDQAAFAQAAEARGAEVVLQAGAWPVVIARVDASAARELARHALVDEAYLSQPSWSNEGNFAQGTLRSPTIWDHGITGDQSVQVLVNDTAQVQVGNPYLPGIITLNTASQGSHATGVAGNIANRHPTYKAAAHGLGRLYSAGGTGDSVAPPIWTTAIAAGVDMGNCSWWNFLKGQIEFLDRFFDHTIRNFSVMMFKSNGNQGSGSSPYGTTPGQGYNMTCSGAYDDQASVNWVDDTMTSSSSYWNPIEGHEKPEVASPGTCVATTGTGGGGIQSCFGGTSSASPLTTGVAALLATADNTLLGQMTTLKAALMVGAWHNVEGAEPISDKDGAGGVHAAASHAVIRDGDWWYDDVVAADFPGGVLDIPIELTAGEDARVIALWFGNADSSYSTDVLDMDVDMAILAPGGGVLDVSASTANPFELVQFSPTTTGTHTVRLTLQRFDGVSEPLTVAWSTRSDAATATVTLDLESEPFSIGNQPTMLFREQYEGPGRIYAAWASLSGPPGASLGAGYGLPAGIDAVSYWSVGLPGFVGVLDASGQACWSSAPEARRAGRQMAPERRRTTGGAAAVRAL